MAQISMEIMDLSGSTPGENQHAKHPKLELLRYLLRMAIKEANEKSDAPEILPDHIQNDANRANSCL